MESVAPVGSFCVRESCENYGVVGAGNVVKYGHSPTGRQRYRCQLCGKTFNENHGTLFFRKRSGESLILEVLALIAEGMRISSVARVKSLKEDTILAWVRQAADHAQLITEALMRDFHVPKAQIDALWSFVAAKRAEKGGLTAAPTGAP